jgi:hypothetical protein
MLAMQYRIGLPADYDMEIIRRRVRTTGHALDAFPGLGVKAFLVRERGVHGSPVNEYAPFYLWADAAGAASFLWSGVGFSAIVRDFGRPAVQTWVGGTSRSGAAGPSSARYAVRRTTALAADADLAAVTARVDADLAAEATRPGVLLAAYGVDPQVWQLVTFTLHATDPGPLPEGAVRYEVLHVSAPEHGALPRTVAPRIGVAPVPSPAPVPPLG